MGGELAAGLDGLQRSRGSLELALSKQTLALGVRQATAGGGTEPANLREQPVERLEVFQPQGDVDQPYDRPLSEWGEARLTAPIDDLAEGASRGQVLLGQEVGLAQHVETVGKSRLVLRVLLYDLVEDVGGALVVLDPHEQHRIGDALLSGAGLDRVNFDRGLNRADVLVS